MIPNYRDSIVVCLAPKQKFVRESPYPVYWVEAFNTALQRWIPVDPLVTKTVAKPLKLEPPANDAENSMSYVVAFEEDGVVRDVTRRYVKAFNAKTRRTRVESTSGGEAWWKGVLNIYQRGYVLVSRPLYQERNGLDAEYSSGSGPSRRCRARDARSSGTYASERTRFQGSSAICA